MSISNFQFTLFSLVNRIVNLVSKVQNKIALDLCTPFSVCR